MMHDFSQNADENKLDQTDSTLSDQDNGISKRQLYTSTSTLSTESNQKEHTVDKIRKIGTRALL